MIDSLYCQQVYGGLQMKAILLHTDFCDVAT